MSTSHVTLKRCLFLIATSMLLLAGAPVAAQQRVALLIGNDNYRHERKLNNPVRDAELLAKVLREELKFDVVRMERNLDISNMDRALDAFAREAKNASTIVFYFSGHGLTDPEARRSYLLPVDARIGSPGSPRIDRQALAAEDLRDRLRKSGAAITLMLLDACRDGPGLGKSGTKGLARIGGGNQLLVAYATEEGKTASDGTSGNSPYAKALAKAWRNADLSILQQLDLVYDEVSRQIPDQQPTREGNLRADAYLNLDAAKQAVSHGRLEEDSWVLCRDAKTLTPCNEYISRWKDGRFSELARIKIQDITSSLLFSADSAPVMLNSVPPEVRPSGRFVDGKNCLREADGSYVVGFRSDCH